MEKKKNSCPLDACEKFFKSIIVSSPFRKIRHRITHHHQDSMPTNPAPNPNVKTLHSAKHTKPVESAQQHKTAENREAAEVVPIKFDVSGLPPPTVQKPRKEPLSQLAQVKKVTTMRKAEISAQAQQKYKGDYSPPSPSHAAVGYGLQGVKTNGKFEPPRVSRMENNKLGANMEDPFTDYINHAGTKIRNTSSVDGKNKASASASEEDDKKDHFSDYIDRAKNKMLRTMSSFAGGRSDSMK